MKITVKIYCIILVLFLVSGISTTALAATATKGYSLVGPNYTKWCSAVFLDNNNSGNILLSVSCGSDATISLLDELNGFCAAVDFFNLGELMPGCGYVDIGDKFYKYVSRNMSVKVKLTDAETDEKIWEGSLKDGDLIYLGNDHKNGYNIYFKQNGMSNFGAHVYLQVLNNLDLK
jgi:hypothetical protein